MYEAVKSNRSLGKQDQTHLMDVGKRGSERQPLCLSRLQQRQISKKQANAPFQYSRTPSVRRKDPMELLLLCVNAINEYAWKYPQAANLPHSASSSQKVKYKARIGSAALSDCLQHGTRW